MILKLKKLKDILSMSDYKKVDGGFYLDEVFISDRMIHFFGKEIDVTLIENDLDNGHDYVYNYDYVYESSVDRDWYFVKSWFEFDFDFIKEKDFLI